MRRIVSLSLTVVLACVGALAPARAVRLPGAAGGAIASDNVEFVATIPDVAAIGARTIGNRMYMTTTDGLRIYDLSLGVPLLTGAFPLPHWENEDVDTNGKILLVSADHGTGALNILYVFDVSIPQAPVLLSTLKTPAGHTASCVLGCTYAWLGGGNGRVYVVNLKDPSHPHNVGDFFVGRSVHDVQVDANGVAWVSAASGIWAFKPTSIPTRPKFISVQTYEFHNEFIIHNSLRPYASKWKPATSWSAPYTDGEMLLVTEENYLAGTNDGCKNDGYFQTGYFRTVSGKSYIGHLASFHVGQGTIGQIGSKKATPMTTCSSHYFGFRSGIAAVAWYEQGVRFLDVSKPGSIRQIGYFMPLAGVAWSVLFKGDYVYVLDAARGIDVLKFHGRPGDKPALAPRYNPVVRTRPSSRWGWACRLPA